MNAAIRFALTAAIALGFASMSFAAGDEAHWGYTGKEGADKWGDLKQEFATCKLGKEQSPIDIRDKDAVKSKLDAIKFDYKPSPLKIIDNGHTIQVNYAPGSSITVGGSQYELLQFHFHKPSEEKVNGKAYAMVAHLVHKNKEGKLAVVGVLLDTGKENPTLKTLWSNLPKEKEKETAVDKVNIDVATLLPRDRNYYTFAGSLTTPPCSESVTWFVLKSPVQASKAQFDAFGKLYAMNARPVQPLNGRVIKLSN
jgi:carbonic anhydrase